MKLYGVSRLPLDWLAHWSVRQIMTKRTRKSISQLAFKRRWLITKLDIHSEIIGEKEQYEIISELENLDLEIAATPSQSIDDLLLKIEWYAQAIYPRDGQPDEETIEDILFSAILEDARILCSEATQFHL